MILCNLWRLRALHLYFVSDKSRKTKTYQRKAWGKPSLPVAAWVRGAWNQDCGKFDWTRVVIFSSFCFLPLRLHERYVVELSNNLSPQGLWLTTITTICFTSAESRFDQGVLKLVCQPFSCSLSLKDLATTHFISWKLRWIKPLALASARSEFHACSFGLARRLISLFIGREVTSTVLLHKRLGLLLQVVWG